MQFNGAKMQKKSFYMSEKSAVHANFEQPSTWQIKCTSHHAQKHHIYVVYSYSPDCIYLLKSTGTLCVSLILTTHGNLLFHSIKKASSACVPSATTTTTIDRSTASLYPWEVDVTHPSNDVRNCCHFDIKIAEFWERRVRMSERTGENRHVVTICAWHNDDDDDKKIRVGKKECTTCVICYLVNNMWKI